MPGTPVPKTPLPGSAGYAPAVSCTGHLFEPATRLLSAGAVKMRSLAELHTEKVTASEKLSALERILSSLRQQSHQLHEDIRTGEAFTKAFTMRASADAQDDDEVLEADDDLGGTCAAANALKRSSPAAAQM